MHEDFKDGKNGDIFDELEHSVVVEACVEREVNFTKLPLVKFF